MSASQARMPGSWKPLMRIPIGPRPMAYSPIGHLRRLGAAVPADCRSEFEDAGHLLKGAKPVPVSTRRLSGSISLTVHTELVRSGPTVRFRSA
ncbi:hypothetical protein SGRIM119S_07654 [Streptomyces griseorubiginosus]